MANAELVRLAPNASTEKIVAAVNSLLDCILGNQGAQVKIQGHDGTSTDPNTGASTGSGLYQAVINSAGANHLDVGNGKVTVTDTAVTVTPSTTFTGAVTGNGTLQFKTPVSAQASANLALSTSFQDITGASVSLTPGVWLVVGAFSFFASGAADVGFYARGQLVTTGGAATVANATAQARFGLDSTTAAGSVAQAWLVTVTATTTAKLQADKTGGAGASTAQQTHTTITATNA